MIKKHEIKIKKFCAKIKIKKHTRVEYKKPLILVGSVLFILLSIMNVVRINTISYK